MKVKKMSEATQKALLNAVLLLTEKVEKLEKKIEAQTTGEKKVFEEVWKNGKKSNHDPTLRRKFFSGQKL